MSTNKNTVFANDIPLGIVLFLMGVLLYFAGWRETGLGFFEFIGLLITLFIARFIVRIGFLLVKGMNVDIS